MDETAALLDELTNRERSALRALLVAALSAAGHPDRGGELQQLLERAPTRALPAAAELHRVTGAVLRGLTGLDGIPSDVERALTDARLRSSLHHLTIVGALSRVADRFDEQGISWVVMKGPIVAAMYPDAGDRSYADLDLLVARQDFPQAMGLLEELGYQSTILNWALAEQMLAGQIGMSTPAVSVDLHWDLFYSQSDREQFDLPGEEMIARSRIVDAAGLRLPTFDSPDTLITLAVHAARSGGHRLLWLKDIERTIAVDRPDFDEVVRRSRTYGCAPPVGIILRRAKSVLGADVPDEILSALIPAPLRAADRLFSALAPPLQFHERDTATRWLSRSVRSSTPSTLSAIPSRTAHLASQRIRPPAANESDDPAEKASYFEAVSTSRPEKSRA